MINKGDIVEVFGCEEALRLKGKTFKVTTYPKIVCGTPVVWLKGESACFAVEFLRKVGD